MDPEQIRRGGKGAVVARAMQLSDGYIRSSHTASLALDSRVRRDDRGDSGPGLDVSTTHIDIGKDYSKLLGPRHIVDGDFSGEDFRKRLLEPAYLNFDAVVVHLDSI